MIANLFKYQKLTLGWALFVLILCCMKTGNVTSSPLFFPGFDKLVHCGMFFVFAVLVNYGLIRQKGNLSTLSIVTMFLVPVAFGGTIELLQQYLFNWRSGEWQDLFADSAGAGMATFSSVMFMIAKTYEKN
jgi:VanZ family protein